MYGCFSIVLLWKQLKGKQMKGYDFHRQKPLDNYIVDFFCAQFRLKAKMTKREKNVSNL